MKSKKIKYGLIGNPLTHSFSERYFSQKFENEGITDYSYHLFPIEKVEYFPFLKKINPNLSGLNVTIPYKEKVLPFLDELSFDAREIGAVNCIRFFEEKLIGFNTDAYGFEISLLNFLNSEIEDSNSQDIKGLILGTGGASKAIRYVFRKLGIEYKMVSRKKGRGDLIYGEITAETISNHRIIVNTTPLGTFPLTDSCPDIPYHLLGKQHYLYDLVYNPEESLFLHRGKKQGANVKNGLEMLYLQAEKSWEIWTE